MSTEPSNASRPVAQQLFQLIFSKVVTQCLGVVAELQIADLLKDGERSIADLAGAAGVHERSLYRVMRALASSGVFAELTPGHFALTPLAEPLRSDSASTLREFAMFISHPVHNAAYADIMHAVRTGEPAFAHTHGAEVFDYLPQDPDFFAVFNDAMTSNSHREARVIAEAYDFAQFDTLVDVGGGLGFLLCEVMKTAPRLHGLLFDLPPVVENASSMFEAAGLSDRVRIEGGSAFDAVPAGADGYMMKYIIHDWDERRATTILRNCARAVRPDGKILVIDNVIPEGDEPHVGKLLDIEMLVMTGGHERTRSEFTRLLAAAELRLTNVVRTGTSLSIVEAQRV